MFHGALEDAVAVKHETVARARGTRERSKALREWSRSLRAFGRAFRHELQGGADVAGTRAERTTAKTRNGGLPAPFEGRTWVGRGSSRICNGCGDVISEAEREFEMDFSEFLSFRFHPECYHAWIACDGDGRP